MSKFQKLKFGIKKNNSMSNQMKQEQCAAIVLIYPISFKQTSWDASGEYVLQCGYEQINVWV